MSEKVSEHTIDKLALISSSLSRMASKTATEKEAHMGQAIYALVGAGAFVAMNFNGLEEFVNMAHTLLAGDSLPPVPEDADPPAADDQFVKALGQRLVDRAKELCQESGFAPTAAIAALLTAASGMSRQHDMTAEFQKAATGLLVGIEKVIARNKPAATRH